MKGLCQDSKLMGLQPSIAFFYFSSPIQMLPYGRTAGSICPHSWLKRPVTGKRHKLSYLQQFMERGECVMFTLALLWKIFQISECILIFWSALEL